MFVSDEPFAPAATGHFLVAVDNLNFFKNNEYKSKYVDGYTLTGAWLRPKLLYYPDKRLRLELGGQVLSYNGRTDYQLFPWFAAVYKPTRQLTLRMGSLDNDRNHGLPEPLFDGEHFLNSRPEAGVQVKMENRKLKADLWIDWQQMIFKGDPYKERFVFGAVVEPTLFRDEQVQLSLPVTFSGQHEGGEIDMAPGLARTHIAVSEGIRFVRRLDGTIIKSWLAEGSLLQSTYPEGETALPARKGSAWYLRAGLTSGYGNLTAGYWQGTRFFTPLGMPLFQNGAIGQPVAVGENRLWTVSYLYDRKIFNQSHFGFVFDLFYNSVTRKPSNSAALYLMINFSALFGKNAG